MSFLATYWVPLLIGGAIGAVWSLWAIAAQDRHFKKGKAK